MDSIIPVNYTQSRDSSRARRLAFAESLNINLLRNQTRRAFDVYRKVAPVTISYVPYNS